MYRWMIVAGVALAFSTTAFAEFYVAKDPATNKCHISKKHRTVRRRSWLGPERMRHGMKPRPLARLLPTVQGGPPRPSKSFLVRIYGDAPRRRWISIDMVGGQCPDPGAFSAL